MQINKRLFGSDIPTKVKQKLEARQKAAENTKNPLDSVLDSSYGSEEKTYKELLNNQFQGYGELSSRTPFVRMWTAISITDIIDEELEQEMRDSKFWLAALVVQTTHSISLKNTPLPAASTAAAPMLGLASMSKAKGEAVAEV